ncbi:hypothetical protein Plhal304r1_c007g0029091 [Plasmopara halstedii]
MILVFRTINACGYTSNCSFQYNHTVVPLGTYFEGSMLHQKCQDLGCDVTNCECT